MYGYDPGANIILRYSVMTIFVASSVFLHLTGSVCTVKSSAGKEVILGSNFTISCTFNKECTKEIFRNMKQISNKQFNNSIVVSVRNLTEFSTFACKCKEVHDPDPCGIDITPGYPPDIPQNLTCVRKTEFGNVSCTWTTGRDTKIVTTCQLRVQGDPHLSYKSVMNSTGFCWSTFPIRSSKMSQLVVSLNVSNSLGSKTSGPHTFTLRNIVKPSIPQISHVNCSSQWCHLHTDNHSMDLVEVQYGAVNGIWKKLETNAKMNLNITSLQPDTKYKFQIRRKINHRVGLWSDWSQEKETKTEEEAPVKELDVWYLQELKHSQSGNKCFHIFWKELNISDAKGKILKYNISVLEQKMTSSNTIPPSRNDHICCSNCSVSVSAVNSKGQSPAKFTELRSPGLQPQECYQGAVTALHTSGPIMAHFRGVSTWQSAPEQGPVPQPVFKNSEDLQVEWSEIPQEKKRGCLKKYTIYLWNKLTEDTQNYSVDYPKKQYTISGLSPGQCYKLWVTAWTDAGEGPRGSDLPFCTPTDAEKLLSHVILAGGGVLLACLILLCICQFSSVQKRFLSCCQCLLPTVIPDPANSNCAKTYTDDQGEIKFYLHKYDPSVSEDPENVEVEEVPYPSFPCTYIKSFSQESSSSDATQSTRTTDYTDDYISTHGAISGGEEEEDEEEEACLDEFEFFPSTHSPFLEPLVLTGGKLTLDAVKIDCSEFLDCT
ncbi:Interleukin-12 receptor subunit beta-2 [Anabarilius grahami]|uniref:Interleukin-12 receptor subunit beta-2 n=1 Tax=Anabarilius grahami TaxID=495550 RepID=A0A3N0YE01_ANAGA|nr:Interleukin-12 receptor subunit beta-2 [Anabarilius grahami]